MKPIRPAQAMVIDLALAVLLTGATGCGTTIQAGERGIKYLALTSPALQEDVKSEGFYFQWPWNGIVKYDITWKSTTEAIGILTDEGLHVRTGVAVTYRPQQEQLYRLQVEIGPAYYEKAIRPPFLTITRGEFAKHHHNGLAKEGGDIEREILTRLRAAVAGKPLEIDRISIVHIEYNPAVTAAISAKLSAAQRVEQKESELKVAERDAEIVRITASGRSDAIRIEAEGEAAAIEVKGKAQAKAQAEITRTLTPNYLRYKAFDNNATRYYFVPTGKDGLPLIVNTESATR